MNRIYTSARGVRLTSPKHVLTLKHGESFSLVSGRTYYVTHDGKLKFRLTKDQYEKLLSRSKEAESDEISITKGKVKPKKKSFEFTPPTGPTDKELLSRIDKGMSGPHSDHLVEYPPNTFKDKVAVQEFFDKNKARIINGFKKNLTKVVENRLDESQYKLEVKQTASSLEVRAPISLPSSKYAQLGFKLMAQPLGDLALMALVYLEDDTPKRHLVYRTPVVKDFFKTFIKMKVKFSKEFKLHSGTTIGPLEVKSNISTPYLAWIRYLATRF